MQNPESEKLLVKRLRPTAKLPVRANPGDAGVDVFLDLGAVDLDTPLKDRVLIIPGGQRRRAPVGVAMVTPEGTYGRIADKSGVAWEHGLQVMGGVCDSTFRGEYEVVLQNTSPTGFVSLEHGQKIAQVVLERVSLAPVVEEMGELPGTARGAGGFGSTGNGLGATAFTLAVGAFFALALAFAVGAAAQPVQVERDAYGKPVERSQRLPDGRVQHWDERGRSSGTTIERPNGDILRLDRSGRVVRPEDRREDRRRD